MERMDERGQCINAVDMDLYFVFLCILTNSAFRLSVISTYGIKYLD